VGRAREQQLPQVLLPEHHLLEYLPALATPTLSVSLANTASCTCTRTHPSTYHPSFPPPPPHTQTPEHIHSHTHSHTHTHEHTLTHAHTLSFTKCREGGVVTVTSCYRITQRTNSNKRYILAFTHTTTPTDAHTHSEALALTRNSLTHQYTLTDDLM